MKNYILYFPTFLLGLGFFEFICQILLNPKSISYWGISVILSGLILIIFSVKYKKQIKDLCISEWSALKGENLLKLALLVCLGIFMFAFWVSTFPPHLVQEFDAINYHMGLTKQHILMGSFSHIEWSSADLWPQIIQWGMASFWFMFKHPTKIAQFVFALWCFFLSLDLGGKLVSDKRGKYIPVLIFFTTHGVMIQLGTAMMDLVFLYFLIASIHAFLNHKMLMGVINLSLFSASKAFMPGVVVLTVILALILFSIKHYSQVIKFLMRYKIFLILFFILTSLFLSRSIVLGVQKAGTPLFPFFTCFLPGATECRDGQTKIVESAKHQLKVRDQYGKGRGPLNFVTHLWEVAVPVKGSNNNFDYPLGWGWLFFILCLFALIKIKIKKPINQLLIYLSLSNWFIWWMGSQQSRWLYPVMLLGLLAMGDVIKIFNKKVLLSCLIISSSLSLISMVRAHSSSLKQYRQEIYAEEVKKVRWSQEGLLDNLHLLYVEKPIYQHAPGNALWIIK